MMNVHSFMCSVTFPVYRKESRFSFSAKYWYVILIFLLRACTRVIVYSNCFCWAYQLINIVCCLLSMWNLCTYIYFDSTKHIIDNTQYWLSMYYAIIFYASWWNSDESKFLGYKWYCNSWRYLSICMFPSWSFAQLHNQI